MMLSSISQDSNKLDEIATAEASRHEIKAQRKPFGEPWGHAYWGKWQTIVFALNALGIREGATILDVGAGGGWTTLFLAQAGYRATGVDIAPANIAVASARAQRTNVSAEF